MPKSAQSCVPVRREAEKAPTPMQPQLAAGGVDEVSRCAVCPPTRSTASCRCNGPVRTLPDLRLVEGSPGGERGEHRDAGRNKTESFGRRAGATCAWKRFSACRESETWVGWRVQSRPACWSGADLLRFQPSADRAARGAACRGWVVSEAHCAQPTSVGREHERASGLPGQRIARLCSACSTSPSSSFASPACR